MNIYKQKYGIVKKQLRFFGRNLKTVQCSDEFWAVKLREIKKARTWEHIITAYMAKYCTVEERKFINSVFFRGENINSTSYDCNLSPRLCFYWEENILKDICGLAMQERLIRFDINNENGNDEIASTRIIISDETWQRIERHIPTNILHRTNSIRESVEAMASVEVMDIRWRELPERYGNWKTVFNRYRRWVKAGLWDPIRAEIYRESE